LSAARTERLSALVADGLAAPKALDEARNAVAQAQRELDLAEQARASWSSKGAALEHAARAAALDARRSALHEASALLESAVLHAPADGQLVRLDVRQGDKLEPGAAAGVLLLHEGRVLVCGISPGELPLVKPGMEADWDEPHTGRRSGRVAAVIGALDPSTGTAELRIAPDPGLAAAPGLALRGEIVLETLEQALLVPAAALVRSQDKSALVLVGSDARAHRIFVEVLARHAGLAAVKGELHAGDAVVVEGAYNLPEGARTVPLTPAPAEPAGGAK
jgi:multidrug efflux system membrane fusion protein